MAFEDTLTLAVIILNIVLTLVLVVIYFRSYRRISSKVTLGLVIFAFAFLPENLFDFYFYNSLLQQGITGITTFHTSVNVFQLVALVILVWVTWK